MADTNTETLTEEERRLIAGWSPKALRIIDAQQAALTEAEADAAANLAAWRRAEKANDELRAENERLRSECQEWNDELDVRVELDIRVNEGPCKAELARRVRK